MGSPGEYAVGVLRREGQEAVVDAEELSFKKNLQGHAGAKSTLYHVDQTRDCVGIGLGVDRETEFPDGRGRNRADGGDLDSLQRLRAGERHEILDRGGAG